MKGTDQGTTSDIGPDVVVLDGELANAGTFLPGFMADKNVVPWIPRNIVEDISCFFLFFYDAPGIVELRN